MDYLLSSRALLAFTTKFAGKTIYMRKHLYIVACASLLIGSNLLAGCNNNKNEGNDVQAPTAVNDQPLAVSRENQPVHDAFTGLLDDYDSLHGALVNWDTAAANKAAAKLAASSKAFPFDQMQSDSSLLPTVRSFVGQVEQEANNIVKTNNIETKRRAFAVLSNNIYDLARTIQYGGSPLYKVTCPMAFNGNEQADWVSRKNEVLNPFLGTSHPKYKKGMLHCGEVSDSMNYRK